MRAGLVAAGIVAVFGIIVVNLPTDRVTIHNRTTVPIEFLTDSLSQNYVAACASVDFEWTRDGGRSGWSHPDGLHTWEGGAVRIEIPDVRPMDGFPGGHFTVVVNSAGVSEDVSGSSLPPCHGTPPP